MRRFLVLGMVFVAGCCQGAFADEVLDAQGKKSRLLVESAQDIAARLKTYSQYNLKDVHLHSLDPRPEDFRWRYVPAVFFLPEGGSGSMEDRLSRVWAAQTDFDRVFSRCGLAMRVSRVVTFRLQSPDVERELFDLLLCETLRRSGKLEGTCRTSLNDNLAGLASHFSRDALPVVFFDNYDFRSAQSSWHLENPRKILPGRLVVGYSAFSEKVDGWPRSSAEWIRSKPFSVLGSGFYQDFLISAVPHELAHVLFQEPRESAFPGNILFKSLDDHPSGVTKAQCRKAEEFITAKGWDEAVVAQALQTWPGAFKY